MPRVLASSVVLFASAVIAAPSWTVVLTDSGPNKLGVVKVVRTKTGLGLKEAKALADGPFPMAIFATPDEAVAQAFARDLVGTGAKAEVRSSQFRFVVISAGRVSAQVTKLITTETGRSLKDVKEGLAKPPYVVRDDLSEEAAARLAGVLTDAGAKVEVGPTTVASPPAPTGPTVSVRLDSAPSKLRCIKVTRQATGLGLAETKKMVESAPVIVKTGLDRAAAEALVKSFGAEGCVATVVEAGAPQP